MQILTDRLRLRAFVTADHEAYIGMNGDVEVMRWLGGPRNPTDSLSEMEYNNGTLENLSFGKVAVERRSDGAFLGICGLSIEDWYPNDLEIGWRLMPEHWGCGYATEAASAWMRHAFQTLSVRRVISICDVPNVRSIAVMRRLGMNLDHYALLDEGTQKIRCVIYSLNRSASG